MESYIKKSDIKFEDAMNILNKPFGLGINAFHKQYEEQKFYINNSIKIVEKIRKQCNDWANKKFTKSELKYNDRSELDELTYQSKLYVKGVNESINKLSNYLNGMMNIINSLNSTLVSIYNKREAQQNRLRSWYTTVLSEAVIKNVTLESTLDLDNKFELL